MPLKSLTLASNTPVSCPQQTSPAIGAPADGLGLSLGEADGDTLGLRDGDALGEALGDFDGDADALGETLGLSDGLAEGEALGDSEGLNDGEKLPAAGLNASITPAR